jgi:zinc transporter, ZIP family
MVDVTESYYATPLINSLIAGLSTGLGAIVILFLRDRGPKSPAIAGSLGLAAGVMITVSVFDVYFPRVLGEKRQLRSLLLDHLALLLGVLFQVILQKCIPEPEIVDLPSNKKEVKDMEVEIRRQRLGVVLAITLSAHNFPEGSAVAVSSLESQKMGLLMTLTIALHNIPEGMCIAVPVFAGTGSFFEAFKMAILSGLTEPLGAFFTLFFLKPYVTIDENAIGYILMFVAGVMISVSLRELIPEAMRCERPKHTISGIVAGSLFMLLTLYLSNDDD